MATVTIKGNLPIDGVYELGLEFNFRDYHIIKKVAGVRANEVMDALEGGDLDIFVALASVALTRAGVRHDPDVLFDLPIDGLVIDFGEEAEVVEDPPTSGGETPSALDAAGSGNGSSPATEDSPPTSEPSFSGTPQPDSTSGPETSSG